MVTEKHFSTPNIDYPNHGLSILY